MAILSKHADHRCQKRSIHPMAIEFLEWFGCARYQKGGFDLLRLPCDPSERAEMRKSLKAALKLMDKDVFVIETEEGKVITAGHQNKRLRTEFN